jgi:hypothetical protein
MTKRFFDALYSFVRAAFIAFYLVLQAVFALRLQ